MATLGEQEVQVKSTTLTALICRSSFSARSIRVWSRLPNDVRSTIALKTFRTDRHCVFKGRGSQGVLCWDYMYEIITTRTWSNTRHYLAKCLRIHHRFHVRFACPTCTMRPKLRFTPKFILVFSPYNYNHVLKELLHASTRSIVWLLGYKCAWVCERITKRRRTWQQWISQVYIKNEIPTDSVRLYHIFQIKLYIFISHALAL